MTGSIALSVARGDGDTASTEFPHVLNGVALAGAAAHLADRLEPEFLAEAGWDAVTRVLSPPSGHRLLGRPICRARGCSTTANGVCLQCRRRLDERGLGLADLGLLPPPSGRAWTMPEDGTCQVTGCPRPWVKAEHPLCLAHLDQQQTLGVSVTEFIARPDVRPLESLGVCAVAACSRQLPARRDVYCAAHLQRLRLARRDGTVVDESHWRATQSPVTRAGRVSLAAMTALPVVQVLFGLQQRTRDGVTTRDPVLRSVCDDLRRQQVTTLEDYRMPPAYGKECRGVLNSLIKNVRSAFRSPDTEITKDEWDMSVFGHRGTLSFAAITQGWLRAAAKAWASNDLPRRRGSWGGDKTRHHIASLAMLSESLRSRPDSGQDPESLGRPDIEAFLSRLAYRESTQAISSLTRSMACTEVRAILSLLRPLGLTTPGGPAAGLGELFMVHRDDIPARPEPGEPGRDLPPEIMRQLSDHLDEIGSPQVRTAVEIAIDTGRRPEEISALPLDCLAFDTDRNPVLVYDNHKANRMGRRLPISGKTAELITAQQQRVRHRYPDTPIGKLKLLPTSQRNPDGGRALTATSLENLHRQWVDAMPPLLLESGAEFDKSRIVLYAYRHTYAQRHADAGVPIDVLAELLDHRNLNVTRCYYRVGEERRRAAVDKVTALSFDRHGNRIWREARALLESEHTRYAVGEVAVPYGTCTEPSNVQAGGGACPVRFRCAGCDHFRTDVSHLPDLTGYLDDLLRTRERLAAAIDGVDDWARTDATPTEEEITRIRRLVNRIKGDITGLSDAERARVDEAVALIRRHRAVSLGIPSVPTSSPTPAREALA